MITYKDLFQVLQSPNTYYPPNVTEGDFPRVLQMMQILCHAEIAIFDKDTQLFRLHPKQIKPVLEVLPSATESPITALPSDLGRVHVDWSGRGHSSGSYAVKADKGKFLEIAFELDVERVMTVAKERTKAAA